MTQERLIMAIGQLERALSRAETNGDNLIKHLKNDNINNDTNFQKLHEKHEMLKKQAGESLRAIDALLTEQAGS